MSELDISSVFVVSVLVRRMILLLMILPDDVVGVGFGDVAGVVVVVGTFLGLPLPLFVGGDRVTSLPL